VGKKKEEIFEDNWWLDCCDSCTVIAYLSIC